MAAEDATFLSVEMTAAMVPVAGGLQRLAERVGRARALKIVLSGEPISGTTAGAMGMAAYVVPSTNVDSTVKDLVGKLATGPTKAYASSAALLKAWSVGGIAAADAQLLDLTAELFPSQDAQRGIAAAIEAINRGAKRSGLAFEGK